MVYVGTDIEEIAHMARSMQNPRFLERVFSQMEIELLQSRQNSAQTAAGNFCAKEAFAKAIGTGFCGFGFCDVSVLRNEQGAPYLVLEGGARQLAQSRGLAFSVSISHCRMYATAVVVAFPTAEKGAQ